MCRSWSARVPDSGVSSSSRATEEVKAAQERGAPPEEVAKLTRRQEELWVSLQAKREEADKAEEELRALGLNDELGAESKRESASFSLTDWLFCRPARVDTGRSWLSRSLSESWKCLRTNGLDMQGSKIF